MKSKGIADNSSIRGGAVELSRKSLVFKNEYPVAI
jgi:hypothetical protein